MTGYAFDLNERQSNRVLEQAARARAQVYLEVSDAQEQGPLTGCITKANDVLTIQLDEESESQHRPICGQYYQVVMGIHHQRYMMVCSVVELEFRQSGAMLILARPKTVQVLQRRKFYRLQPGQMVPVYVTWKDSDGTMHSAPTLGQLQDIHPEGMGVKLPMELDQDLFIGEIVHIRFSINAREPDFEIVATICHKKVRKERNELFIGLQFELDHSEESQRFSQRLQQVLSVSIPFDRKKAGN